jgi:hypothetical protein
LAFPRTKEPPTQQCHNSNTSLSRDDSHHYTRVPLSRTGLHHEKYNSHASCRVRTKTQADTVLLTSTAVSRHLPPKTIIHHGSLLAVTIQAAEESVSCKRQIVYGPLEDMLGDPALEHVVATNSRIVPPTCRLLPTSKPQQEQPSHQAALHLYALTVVKKATPGHPAKCPSLGIFLSMGSPQSSVPSIDLNLNRIWLPCGWHVLVYAMQ